MKIQQQMLYVILCTGMPHRNSIGVFTIACARG
jgi:hypothetical protein